MESTYGEGSQLTAEINLEAMDRDPFPRFEGKTALIMDENPVWQTILQTMLGQFGIQARQAHDKHAVLNWIATQHLDVLLIDWNLPDRAETLRRLQAQTTAPIILLGRMKQATNFGAMVQKPLNPARLHAMLTSVLMDKALPLPYERTPLSQDLPALAGKAILLVEDNPTNQIVIQGLLEESGVDIDVAENGKEALNLFEYHPRKYCLILMDIQMPIMDGYEATVRIRALDPEIPVIALTAHAMKEDAEKSRRAGLNAHLNKPVEVDKLYEVLLHFCVPAASTPVKVRPRTHRRPGPDTDHPTVSG